jgi:sulfatase maturation enzyme AslB (radical SAM superfamily)
MNLTPSQLVVYLQQQHGFYVVDTIDLDWLHGQPRHTLYRRFTSAHKPVFENHERVVLYSRHKVTCDIMTHVQKCGSKIDISNAFILICAPCIDIAMLDKLRQDYSTDERIFDTIELDFVDALEYEKNNRTFDLPESFCFSPWAHLEISTQGEFRPCCVYSDPIKDSQGRPYNIASDSVYTVYHSQYLRDLRNQFLSGQRPQECSHCWRSEKTMGYSNRNWLASHLSVNADCLHIEDTNDISNLISLDIKLGNTCNFKCRICNPQSSSRIAEERWRHGDRSFDIKQLNSKAQWTDDSKIWQTLNSLGHQLINIDFYGGEPFLIKQHERFLDYLVVHGYANRIRLHYNSNGSVYPQALFTTWSEFREVNISFSIDDIGARFELQRGGCWLDVEQNLSLFLQSRLPNMTLGIFPTVNAQNIYYLPELIEWFETKTFDSLVFNILETPKCLSITNMGHDLTDLVVDRLSWWVSQRSEIYDLKRLIDRIKQNKKTEDKVDELRNYVLQLDNIRDQDFSASHPEVAKIIYEGTKNAQTI